MKFQTINRFFGRILSNILFKTWYQNLSLFHIKIGSINAICWNKYFVINSTIIVKVYQKTTSNFLLPLTLLYTV